MFRENCIVMSFQTCIFPKNTTIIANNVSEIEKIVYGLDDPLNVPIIYVPIGKEEEFIDYAAENDCFFVISSLESCYNNGSIKINYAKERLIELHTLVYSKVNLNHIRFITKIEDEILFKSTIQNKGIDILPDPFYFGNYFQFQGDSKKSEDHKTVVATDIIGNKIHDNENFYVVKGHPISIELYHDVGFKLKKRNPIKISLHEDYKNHCYNHSFDKRIGILSILRLSTGIIVDHIPQAVDIDYASYLYTLWKRKELNKNDDISKLLIDKTRDTKFIRILKSISNCEVPKGDFSIICNTILNDFIMRFLYVYYKDNIKKICDELVNRYGYNHIYAHMSTNGGKFLMECFKYSGYIVPYYSAYRVNNKNEFEVEKDV